MFAKYRMHRSELPWALTSYANGLYAILQDYQKVCHWFRKIITKEHKLLGLAVIIEPGNNVLTHISLHLRFQLPKAFLTESWTITRYVLCLLDICKLFGYRMLFRSE